MIDSLQLLTFIVFVPALAAVLLAFFPKNNHEGMRIFTLVVTVLVLVPVLWMALPGGSRCNSIPPLAACKMIFVWRGFRHSTFIISWEWMGSVFHWCYSRP